MKCVHCADPLDFRVLPAVEDDEWPLDDQWPLDDPRVSVGFFLHSNGPLVDVVDDYFVHFVST